MAHTPTPWRVRSPERNGLPVDHFVVADDVNGYPYDAEILGDDEYRDQSGGLSRKYDDCQFIVTAVNAYEANQARIAELEKALKNATDALAYCLPGMTNDPLEPKIAVTLRKSCTALNGAAS